MKFALGLFLTLCTASSSLCMEDMLEQLAQTLPTPVSAGGAAGNAVGRNNEDERYQKSLAALSKKSGRVSAEPADGTSQAASLSDLKEPDPATPRDNASQVTGVEDLPTAPAQVQMAEDSSFQTFLRGHGWHPQGEHKRNIAQVATCDCCLITCCILSCNCCCGRYGSFACTYCGGACNCNSGD